MNRKILPVLAVIVVVVILAVAFLPLGNIGKSIAGDFGFNMEIVGSNGASPFVNGSSNLTFKTLAKNPTVLGEKGNGMAKDGWDAWHISSTNITIYTGSRYNNSTDFTPIHFAKIQNTATNNATVHLFENLTGSRVMSYSITSASAPTGYVIAITNGTNSTVKDVNSTAGLANYTTVGFGHILNGTENVVVPRNDYLYITLDTLPTGYNNGSRPMLNEPFGITSISL